MSQTKKQSLQEAIVNTAIGLVTAFCINALLLPLFGLPYETLKFTLITIAYTLISVTRNYIVRRVFSKREA